MGKFCQKEGCWKSRHFVFWSLRRNVSLIKRTCDWFCLVLYLSLFILSYWKLTAPKFHRKIHSAFLLLSWITRPRVLHSRRSRTFDDLFVFPLTIEEAAGKDGKGRRFILWRNDIARINEYASIGNRLRLDNRRRFLFLFRQAALSTILSLFIFLPSARNDEWPRF